MKKPVIVGLNKDTYRWLCAEKSIYKPADETWFKTSYPIFSSGKSPHTKDDFYRVIAFAYSWMPTIPNVKQIGNKQWREIKRLLPKIARNPEPLRKLLVILIPIINNSLVGTSKVLHFISPEQVPIIDSRVLANWNRIFKQNKELTLKKTLLLDSNKTRQIKNYLKYRDMLIEWQSKCGRKVTIRKLEELLYYQKIRIAKK
jgi:hypothetical protein